MPNPNPNAVASSSSCCSSPSSTIRRPRYGSSHERPLHNQTSDSVLLVLENGFCLLSDRPGSCTDQLSACIWQTGYPEKASNPVDFPYRSGMVENDSGKTDIRRRRSGMKENVDRNTGMVENANKKTDMVATKSRRKSAISEPDCEPSSRFAIHSSLRKMHRFSGFNQTTVSSSHTSSELSFPSPKPVASSSPSPVWKSNNNKASIARRNCYLPPIDSSEHDTTSIDGEGRSLSSSEFYFKENDTKSHICKESRNILNHSYHRHGYGEEGTETTELGEREGQIPNSIYSPLNFKQNVNRHDEESIGKLCHSKEPTQRVVAEKNDQIAEFIQFPFHFKEKAMRFHGVEKISRQLNHGYGDKGTRQEVAETDDRIHLPFHFGKNCMTFQASEGNRVLLSHGCEYSECNEREEVAEKNNQNPESYQSPFNFKEKVTISEANKENGDYFSQVNHRHREEGTEREEGAERNGHISEAIPSSINLKKKLNMSRSSKESIDYDFSHGHHYHGHGQEGGDSERNLQTSESIHSSLKNVGNFSAATCSDIFSANCSICGSEQQQYSDQASYHGKQRAAKLDDLLEEQWKMKCRPNSHRHARPRVLRDGLGCAEHPHDDHQYYRLQQQQQQQQQRHHRPPHVCHNDHSDSVMCRKRFTKEYDDDEEEGKENRNPAGTNQRCDGATPSLKPGATSALGRGSVTPGIKASPTPALRQQSIHHSWRHDEAQEQDEGGTRRNRWRAAAEPRPMAMAPLHSTCRACPSMEHGCHRHRHRHRHRHHCASGYSTSCTSPGTNQIDTSVSMAGSSSSSTAPSCPHTHHFHPSPAMSHRHHRQPPREIKR